MFDVPNPLPRFCLYLGALAISLAVHMVIASAIEQSAGASFVKSDPGFYRMAFTASDTRTQLN